MSLLTNLQSLVTTMAGTVKPLLWLPAEPPIVEGKTYAPCYKTGGWTWSEVPAGAPPLDTFIDGWSAYPFQAIADVLETGTIHAAVNCGPETGFAIGTTTFEQSATNSNNSNVPAAGWPGTNWLIERASSAPVPPVIGNNTGNLQVAPFADFPDPTYGQILNVVTLCSAAIRRNIYLTFSNLVVGNRYYVVLFFGSYPEVGRRNTLLVPSDGGDFRIFAPATDESIIERGIQRYGFTAASTAMSFTKSSYDVAGSYMNGFACIDMGT